MDFFKKIWITGSTSIVVTILAFVNNIIVTRALGPEGRGIYAVISNLILLLMLVFGEGIRRSNVILIGRKKDATRQLLTFTLKYSAVLIIIFIFILLIKPVYDSLLPNISTLLLVLGFAVAFFTILWQAVQAISLGQQKIIDYNVMLFTQIAIVLIINILGVLLFNFSVGEFITSLLVSACLTLLIGVIRLKDKRNDFNTDYKINSSEVFSISLKSTSASILMFLTLRG
ncbi:MAG: oligosaccharide flippase family protein, partial [Melioribacteraceae bacterium]|nr:oligosaccharide flippase family protein [Melioribacteraceae bacterium]